jgi:hypothetical protein
MNCIASMICMPLLEAYLILMQKTSHDRVHRRVIHSFIFVFLLINSLPIAWALSREEFCIDPDIQSNATRQVLIGEKAAHEHQIL